jgi:uncharacterized membrane protein
LPFMYKIIGADQKEYGPSSADEIRQWVIQGRANGQTSVQAEGSDEWKPLSSYPEFAHVLEGIPAAVLPPALPVDHSTLPPDITERDYELDIGRCVSRSWELVKKNFWPVVGVTFLVGIVIGIINQGIGLISRSAVQSMMVDHDFSTRNILLVSLTSVIGMPVDTVLYGGLYKYYLKLIRGEEANISDAFSGLTSSFVQLVILGLVMGILVILGIFACIIPGIYLGVAWAFAIPLVIDKKMDFWSAMELSRKVVTKHWFAVFALLIVVGLISISGIIACFIGIFVTISIGWVALMYAYEDIFGHKTR